MVVLPNPQPNPQARAPQGPPAFSVPEPVATARFRRIHLLALLSFLLLALLPGILAAGYVWTRATDQFASRVGFSIRQTGGAQPSGLGNLAGLAAIGGLLQSKADDADILNEYLRSLEIVRTVQDRIDLRAIWGRADADRDPVFAFRAEGTIEDLHAYWQRMVRISYAGGSGLITVEARAFTAEDAQALSSAIFAAGSAKINALNDIAREDLLRYARDEVVAAEDRLARARARLTEFRNRTQIVDPAASLSGQMGLLQTLQSQLADALIRFDLLTGTTRADDPRLRRTQREIDVIKARIGAERDKLGLGGGDASDAYATLFGEYELLAIEKSFAEEAYVAARAAFEQTRAEAGRRSLYLAAHVSPTRPERSEYPRRLRSTGIIAGFLLLGWSLFFLTAVSLRDRK